MAAAPDAAVVVPVLLPPPVPQVQPTLKDIVVEFPVDGGRGRLVAVLPLPPDHELRRSLDSVAEALASGRLAAVLPPARRNTVAAVLARSRLAAAAADALMYLALAGMWIFQAGMAAQDVGRGLPRVRLGVRGLPRRRPPRLPAGLPLRHVAARRPPRRLRHR